LTPDKLIAVKKHFEEMLRLGHARPAEGPRASPLHVNPKLGEERGACSDYRALKARTCPDQYPLSHIEDVAWTDSVFHRRPSARIKKIPLSKEDIPKTAITTPFGLFEFTYMNFGHRNAAQTIQRFIDKFLQGVDFC
jgi:hypothetical protein